MRKAILTMAAVISLGAGLGAGSSPAQAIGCLSGGAAGALAGHMAGHGVLGALGGCVAGHQWHKHQVNKRNLRDAQAYDAQRRAADPSYQSPWNR